MLLGYSQTMRIAITGGIAEGKSTVLRILADMGHETASSDAYARECFYEASVQQGLASLLRLPAPVEPAQLRKALAESSEIRRGVNRLIHPHVVHRIVSSSAVFVEVPLLIESCLQSLFEQVWVVTCGPEEQLRRIVERDGPELAQKLVDSQLKSFAKTPFGDVVLRTNEGLETVKRNIRHAAKFAVSE